MNTRIDTMSKDQAESSCAKLDALLRNSTAQYKLVSDRTQGNRVDFIEPQRNKRESTPLPRRAASIGSGGQDNYEGWNLKLDKGALDSTTSTNVGPDAMTRANTWEMMNRTLEAFATRNTDSSERGGGKSRKTFKRPKEFTDDSDG